MRSGQHSDRVLVALGCIFAVACGEAADNGNTNVAGAAGTGALPMAGTGAGMTALPMGGTTAGTMVPTAGTTAGMVAVPMAGTTAGAMAGTTGGVMAGTTGGVMAGTTGGMEMAGTTGGMEMAGTTGGDGMPTAGTGGSGDSACLDDITDFASAGPFEFTGPMAFGSVKAWVPMVPAGCKVPVIHLANGTGATCGTYGASMQRLASHGFLAVCFENTNTGAGTQGITAFETAFEQFPDLASHKLGSTGHSQGGQAAFTVLALAEEKWGDEMIYAGLAMEPASGFGTQPSGGTWQQVYAKIKSPMFMFSGTADTLVSEAWVRRGFDALADTTEAYWYSAVGATHIPVPNPQEIEVSIPWFRWKLLGDKAACMAFKALPDTERWDAREEQNPVGCD